MVARIHDAKGTTIQRWRPLHVKKLRKVQRFTVVLERDEDGMYVVSIPALPGCHTQGRSLDQAMRRIREAAELWLQVHRERRGAVLRPLELVGVQQLEVPA
jgi:predicted RNase H-like HicB family nuclease